jgi:hypothetical protein
MHGRIFMGPEEHVYSTVAQQPFATRFLKNYLFPHPDFFLPSIFPHKKRNGQSWTGENIRIS